MLTIPQSLEVDPAYQPFLALTDAILLRPGEVARHLRITLGHLGLMRRRGGGPRYVMVGRHVRYRHSDVLAYELSRTAGPVTPDSLALAVSTVPGMSPMARDFVIEHLTKQLFTASELKPRKPRRSKR